MTYLGIFKILFPYMSAAFVGGAFNRFGITRGKPEKLMLKALINFFMPVMIFNYVVGNKALADISNVISAPVVGFYGIVIGFAVSWYLAGYFGAKNRDAKASFAFTVGIYNYGFLSIPITEFTFGKETVGLLLVHNIGIDLAYWSVGVGLMTGFSYKNFTRVLKNPPLLSVIISLAVNFFIGGDALPSWVYGVMHPIALVSIPIGIFISGAALAESAGALMKKGGFRISVGAVILRMFVIPVIMVLTVKFLPVSYDLKMITAVQASMPAGMLTIAIIKYFGGDLETAVQTILTTTAVSLITIPVWIEIFSRFLA